MLKGTISLFFALNAALLLNSAHAAAPTSTDAFVTKSFVDNCAKCHGATGQGDTWRGMLYFTPNFSAAKWQKGISDDEILSAINHGPRIMPAFERAFSASEKQALVQHVRGLAR